MFTSHRETTDTFEPQLGDKDRCSLGLGWEYARRGRPLDDNPYVLGSWKYEAFAAGWRRFQFVQTRKCWGK